MNSSDTGLKSANWQVTASTVECELVKEYVTIMVNKDWSCKCVWWAKNKNVIKEGSKNKSLSCQGPDCKYVIQYRDKLIEEEKK